MYAVGIEKAKKEGFYMKKIFAIILTLCLLASVFCIPAFASAAPSASEDTVDSETQNQGPAEKGESLVPEKGSPNDGRGALGSLFGNGSLTMIVALLALATSILSICITVNLYKKKPTSSKAEDGKKDEKE
jgi:hypothetical protein